MIDCTERQNRTHKYEQLIQADLPQICEFFVFCFRLRKIERPNGRGRLIVLDVRVPTFRIWIVAVWDSRVRWGCRVNLRVVTLILSFCGDIELTSDINTVDADLGFQKSVAGLRDLVRVT